jgi:hypothetical protein
MSEYRELLIGCGRKRDKRIDPRRFMAIRGTEDWAAADQVAHGVKRWFALESLDSNPKVNPDIVWNLDLRPWCRSDENCRIEAIAEATYDEIHAYEVLEHLGRQGDYREFFGLFSEVWRLLKPGGLFAATCPSRFSQWLWGDPGHTRAIPPCMLIFLCQPQYTQQCGRTAMSDYRDEYQADFDVLNSYDDKEVHQFVLQAIKPSRHEILL